MNEVVKVALNDFDHYLETLKQVSRNKRNLIRLRFWKVISLIYGEGVYQFADSLNDEKTD